MNNATRTTGTGTCLLLAASVVLASPGAAQEPAVSENAKRYASCMELTRADPQAAFDTASQWHGLGGGEVAQHCTAAALFALGRYGEAAQRFEVLAFTTQRGKHFQAELLSQAAQGWLWSGDTAKAATTLNSAIGLKPQDPDLYIDRSVAHAILGRYGDARQDLDQAIHLAPVKAEAYALRAAAWRLLDQLDAAAADAERAIAINPNLPEALLERGIVRRLKGDDAGAQRDWQRLIEVAPGGEAARAAQQNIDKMDAGTR